MDEQRQYRLKKAIKASYATLRPHRDESRTLVKKFAGHRYNPDSTDYRDKHPRYINLMHQAIEAYKTLLVGPNPQVHLTATNRELKGFAKQFEMALNNLADEIQLGEKFGEWILSAFFGIGILKVHMADSGEVISEGEITMDPGQPYVSVISLDNWVHDSTAKSWSECKFFGDLYQLSRANLNVGVEEGRYDKEAVAGVTPRKTSARDGERTETLGSDVTDTDADVDEMVDLIDVYLPHDRKIYTFHVSDHRQFEIKGKPLQVMDWYGTELGPYKKLALSHVLENVMPTPPASHWVDLDREINNLLRKSIKQGRRARRVLAHEPAAADDVKKIVNTPDGSVVSVSAIEKIQEMQIGAVDGGVFAFNGELIKMFDRMVGNLQALLGLGASADTVGQEKLIFGSVGRQGESLQSQVVTQAGGVFKELGYLLWNDEFKTLPASVSPEGFPELTADASWKPGDREGLFSDYKIRCDVYSLRATTPAERMQMIEGVLQRLIIPMAPFLQQQGGTVDVAELVSQAAELMNAPRLRDIVKFTQPPGMSSPRNDIPRSSPVSNRTYTRRNISGDEGQLDASSVSQAQQPQT